MSSFSFHKNERLKSRKTISRIFEEGNSLIAYPIRIAWVKQDDQLSSIPKVQFTQSVPKRRYPKAVQRNKIRRRIREAYRLKKHILINELESAGAPAYALIAIYIGKEELPFDVISKATDKWMKKFLKTVKDSL